MRHLPPLAAAAAVFLILATPLLVILHQLEKWERDAVTQQSEEEAQAAAHRVSEYVSDRVRNLHRVAAQLAARPTATEQRTEFERVAGDAEWALPGMYAIN